MTDLKCIGYVEGMLMEDLLDFKNRIKNFDDKCLEERSIRALKLGSYTISLVDNPVPDLMSEYMQEAHHSFVYGSFRSCIFACSAVVEQVFKHEIVRSIDHEILLDTNGREISFGKTIGLTRKHKVSRLAPLLDKANWINKARNRIAVHPICITSEELDEKLANKLKIGFIKNVLELVDEKDRENILNESVHYPNEDRIVLRDVLDDPDMSRASELLMWGVHNRIIEPVALKAYLYTKEILIHLFPA